MEQLLPSKIIKGRIILKTGLHIGEGNDRIEIGGIDMPVIKNPNTKDPYIPGSSIKGKMRSLLEWRYNNIHTFGEKRTCNRANDRDKCPICRIFGAGNSGDEKAWQPGPTRLIVRDAVLTKESLEKLDAFRKGEANARPILEDKVEIVLNRVSAKATPRHLERIVPGIDFDFEMVFRKFKLDGEDENTYETLFKSYVIEGLKLLENDYLGGGGSRGNGRIEIKIFVEKDVLKNLQEYYDALPH
jgi:CRISPR-associated protein Csm3